MGGKDKLGWARIGGLDKLGLGENWEGEVERDGFGL
jgi:hypothetical protein